MGWEILWPLILGFALSGVVQAAVTKGEMSPLARFLVAFDHDCDRTRGCVVVLFLRGCGAGAIVF